MTYANPLTLTTPVSGAGAAGRTAAAGQGGGGTGPSLVQRVYRLVDRQGNPHPVLDDLYDTLEAAWAEAQDWWSEHCGGSEAVEIGVEVSTSCGSWRTLRHPAG